MIEYSHLYHLYLVSLRYNRSYTGMYHSHFIGQRIQGDILFRNSRGMDDVHHSNDMGQKWHSYCLIFLCTEYPFLNGHHTLFFFLRHHDEDLLAQQRIPSWICLLHPLLLFLL